jgi:hypothetical protein
MADSDPQPAAFPFSEVGEIASYQTPLHLSSCTFRMEIPSLCVENIRNIRTIRNHCNACNFSYSPTSYIKLRAAAGR